MPQWIGNRQVHLLFEIAAYVSAAALFTWLRSRQPDPLPSRHRVLVLISAGLGASIGMRALYWISNPQLLSAHGADPSFLFGGKTVIGGLLGALVAVEITKKILGVERSTGDLFVYPTMLAIAIGRVGCFLYGPADQTAGIPSDLPWAIAIADGVRRHPVALYEIAFLALLFPIIRRVGRTSPWDGERFRIFLSSYLLFRLLVDFLKPDPPRVYGGMSAIQWACVAGLVYYASVYARGARMRTAAV